jgi:putative addiction module killer protein
VDAGPGYRIYYAIDDGDAVLLFQGGNKQTQKEDIKMAIRRWQDWKQRRKNEKR